MDVLRRDKTEIDLIDARAVIDVERHARRRDDVFERQRRVLPEKGGVERLCAKLVFGRGAFARAVDFPDALYDLEQTRPSGNSVALERRRNGKADCFFGAREVCDDEVGRHGIEPALHALHGGVK